MPRPLLLMLGFGLTVGTLLDALHTFSGTTQYLDPLVLDTAWWAPLLFTAAYGVGGSLFAVSYARLGGDRALRSWPELAIAILIFALLYALTGVLPASNLAKLIVVGASAVGLWLWLDRSQAGVIGALSAAVVGPVTEIVLIRLGLFRHLQPDLLGIPLWLPALYLAAGPTVGQLARKVWASSASATH